MSFMQGRRPSHGTVVAYLALFLAIGGRAYAASGSFVGHNGAINGCVPKGGGALKVFKPGKKCPGGNVPVSFNAKGPEGPAGPQGLPGKDGAAGLQGPIGPATYAAVDNLGEGTPTATPNAGGFEVIKSINLPSASHVLVYASGLYGFECTGACSDDPGLYVDNVPVPGTDVHLIGPESQFVTSMGVTTAVLPAGPHTVKWTDNATGALERSGPINSTGVVAAIATG